MKKALLWIGLIATAAGAIIAVLLLSPKRSSKPSPTPTQPVQRSSTRLEDFVGAETCAKCHAQQYDLWRRSTHGKAGGKPGETEIIAHFDGKPLHFKDAVVAPSTNARGDYVFVVQLQGAP